MVPPEEPGSVAVTGLVVEADVAFVVEAEVVGASVVEVPGASVVPPVVAAAVPELPASVDPALLVGCEVESPQAAVRASNDATRQAKRDILATLLARRRRFKQPRGRGDAIERFRQHVLVVDELQDDGRVLGGAGLALSLMLIVSEYRQRQQHRERLRHLMQQDVSRQSVGGATNGLSR